MTRKLIMVLTFCASAFAFAPVVAQAQWQAPTLPVIVQPGHGPVYAPPVYAPPAVGQAPLINAPVVIAPQRSHRHSIVHRVVAPVMRMARMLFGSGGNDGNANANRGGGFGGWFGGNRNGC